MKKAVISSGNKQYVVTEGQIIEVELLKSEKDKVSFDSLLVIDGEKVTVGTPLVEGVKVSADILDHDKQADKVTSIRYKAKKRVRKVKGHRQHQTILKITKIS